MIRLIDKSKGSIKRHKTILENMSWVAAVEVFILLAPFITYPYLTRVLGLELYGLVISAQVLASYATLIIDFGSNSVVAKHVSINRDNKSMLSEIVSSVFIVRGVLWIVCLAIYVLIVCIVPIYRKEILLFLFTYGLTLHDVLFPRYFFQGIEKMRISSIINIGIKLLFILLIFVVVRSEEDYLYVPLLYTAGYTIAGVVSVIIIFGRMKLRFYIPPFNRMMIYVKDSAAIFATDVIRTVKDKFNYFFLGGFSGMANVVVYDLGLKLNSIIVKPTQIICQVLFPRFAKTRDKKKLNKMIWVVLIITIVTVVVVNIFLPWVAKFFLHTDVDLLPLRIFSLAPIFLSVASFISSNYFVAFGYNKYMLYSIIITTVAYLAGLGFVVITNNLNSVYSFVSISLFSYFVEFLYRIITKERLMRKELLIEKTEKTQ